MYAVEYKLKDKKWADKLKLDLNKVKTAAENILMKRLNTFKPILEDLTFMK